MTTELIPYAKGYLDGLRGGVIRDEKDKSVKEIAVYAAIGAVGGIVSSLISLLIRRNK